MASTLAARGTAARRVASHTGDFATQFDALIDASRV